MDHLFSPYRQSYPWYRGLEIRVFCALRFIGPFLALAANQLDVIDANREFTVLLAVFLPPLLLQVSMNDDLRTLHQVFIQTLGLLVPRGEVDEASVVGPLVAFLDSSV